MHNKTKCTTTTKNTTSASQEQDLYDRGMNRVTDTCIPEDTAIRRIETVLLELYQVEIMCMCMCVWCMWVYVCMCVCMCVCVYVRMGVWVYGCMGVCVYMHVCENVCMCVCVYVCMAYVYMVYGCVWRGGDTAIRRIEAVLLKLHQVELMCCVLSVCVCVCMYVCMYHLYARALPVHTYTHIHIHTHTYYPHTHQPPTHTHTHAHTHTHTHTHTLSLSLQDLSAKGDRVAPHELFYRIIREVGFRG